MHHKLGSGILAHMHECIKYHDPVCISFSSLFENEEVGQWKAQQADAQQSPEESTPGPRK